MKTYSIDKYQNLFKATKTACNKRVACEIEVADWQLKVMIPVEGNQYGLLLTRGSSWCRQWAGEFRWQLVSLSLAQPTYLHLLLQHAVSTHSSLRSGSQNLLALPTLSSEFGRHAFSYCAPSVWNTLPLSVRSLNSFNSFKSHLKRKKPICLLIINIHCPLAT